MVHSFTHLLGGKSSRASRDAKRGESHMIRIGYVTSSTVEFLSPFIIVKYSILLINLILKDMITDSSVILAYICLSIYSILTSIVNIQCTINSID